MSLKVEKMGQHALICSMGGLTRLRDGLIGVDLDETDAVTWYAPSAEGLQAVVSTMTDDDMGDLLQTVIEVGLEEAGIVDVNNPGIR